MPENPMTFKEALTAYWKRAKEQSQALPTGLPRLDEFLKGDLFPGETTLVAGRPHMGKTSLLLNITDNLLKEGRRVLFFVGAVEPERFPLFLISLRHRINLKWVREGFSKTDEELIQSYIEAKEEVPLFIEDIFLTPPDELFEKIVLYRKSYNPDLVVIDSLPALMIYPEKEMETIQEIADTLPRLARELGIHIIATTCLASTPDKRKGHRPELKDLGKWLPL